MVKQSIHNIKTNHLYQMTWDLFIKGNATMQELINSTGLSQPSVRNMIRELQQSGLIEEIGNDHSTGGRCPTRFGLTKEHFHILNLYVHEKYVDYQMICYREVEKQDRFEYKNDNELIEIIKTLINENGCQYCIIAVEGMVDQDIYITDHYNTYQENRWVVDLKALVDIPIYLENDVKVMQLGRFYQGYKDRSVYLYINDIGIGCSYMDNGKLLKGEHGLSGEIGLIPYQGKTLNQCIRECQSEEEFIEIVIHLLIIIYSFVDPKHVDLFYNKKDIYVDIIRDKLIKQLPHYKPFDICVVDDCYNDLYMGMSYLGIDCLLKKLTEERK
ncbi:MAG: ROK family transcriptional regulator [Coprobacillus sp.]